MMCSKTNASRINFELTGPLGEVGIRERLRRQLTTSLDLEEIQAEMARDKGYGGRSKRKHVQDSLMHDRDRSSPTLDIFRITDGNGSDTYFEDVEDGGNGSTKLRSSLQLQDKKGGHGLAAAANVVPSGVASMMDEQIASDSFVLNPMDRLAALEQSLRTKSAEVAALSDEQTSRRASKPSSPMVPGKTHVASVEVRK